MGLLDLFRGSPEERLAKKYMAALRSVGVAGKMRYDKDEDAIVVDVPDGSAGTFKANLGNVRKELERSPASEHEQILHTFALGMIEGQSESAETYVEAKPRLMAVVKDDSYPQFTAVYRAAQGSTSEEGIVSRPFAPGIVLVAVEDLPNSFRAIPTSDPARWGVTEHQLMADAIENACALPASFRFEEGVWLLEQDDAYATSRLLNPGVFRTLQIKGAPVVIVPDRQTVAVTGADDPDGLAALGRALDVCVRAGRRPISAIPLVVGESGWEEFRPPPSLQTVFGNARRMLAANFWLDFKDASDKVYAANGQDIFIANLAVVESNETGAYESLVVWSKGVDAILPVADRVMFYEAEGAPVRRADWTAVVRVMGEVMERLPSKPERYRVRTYPTAEQFVAMGAERVQKEG